MNKFAIIGLIVLFIAACEKVPAYTDGDRMVYAKNECGQEVIDYQGCIDYHVARVR